MIVSSRRRVDGSGAETGDRPGHRGSVRTAAIVALLVSAIALANRGWPGSGPSAAPVDGLSASEALHNRAGAQSAATTMASALGGERMFNKRSRHQLLRAIAEPRRRDRMIQDYDAAYTAAFNARLGLDREGRPRAAAQFVSRTMPAGTTVRSYRGGTARVSVWCSTLFGLADESAPTEIPVESGWITMTITLRWTEAGWRLAAVEQSDGPEPASGVMVGEAPRP